MWHKQRRRLDAAAASTRSAIIGRPNSSEGATLALLYRLYGQAVHMWPRNDAVKSGHADFTLSAPPNITMRFIHFYF